MLKFTFETGTSVTGATSCTCVTQGERLTGVTLGLIPPWDTTNGLTPKRAQNPQRRFGDEACEEVISPHGYEIPHLLWEVEVQEVDEGLSQKAAVKAPVTVD